MTKNRITELPDLPPRPSNSNKGTFGRACIVAGSRGMSGAAVLAGSAALRAGAGLVIVAIPEGIQSIVAMGNPCYLTVGLPEDDTGGLSASAKKPLLDRASGCDVIAVGPGLGQGQDRKALVMALIEETSVPLLLDADALNVLEGETSVLEKREAPLILTPHPGEFSRLTGAEIDAIQADREARAFDFAAKHKVVLLLKGEGTVVTDGSRIYVNETGCSGLATGGTGDVLTGLIAGLIAQGMEPFPGAQLGAHVHGLAGELGCDTVGEHGLIATDLLEYLPPAFGEHLERDNPPGLVP